MQAMRRNARRTFAVLGLMAVTALVLPAHVSARGYSDDFVPRTLSDSQDGQNHGQRPAPPSDEERQKWEAMTPEERQAAHQKRRAEFEKLSPEERQAKFGNRRPPGSIGRPPGNGEPPAMGERPGNGQRPGKGERPGNGQQKPPGQQEPPQQSSPTAAQR